MVKKIIITGAIDQELYNWAINLMNNSDMMIRNKSHLVELAFNALKQKVESEK